MTEKNIEAPAASEQSISPLYKWLITWFRAVTSPRIDTYRQIAHQANVKTSYLWIVLSLLVSSIFSMIIIGWFTLATDIYGDYSDLVYGARSVGLRVAYGGVGLLAYVVVGLTLFSGVTALSNTIAKAFGGVGDYRQLIYCFAAFSVPVSIASLILGFLSQVPCLLALINLGSLIIFVYTFALTVIAIKAIHQIEIWQAAVPGTLIVALSLVIACCGMTSWVIFTVI